MTTANNAVERFKAWVWVIGIAGTFLLTAVLIWAMYHYTRPEDLTAARALERYGFLGEVRAAETKALTEYAWRDREKGLVILPIERALELTVQEWENPGVARSNLLATLAKALEQPPPPPPPANPYE